MEEEEEEKKEEQVLKVEAIKPFEDLEEEEREEVEEIVPVETKMSVLHEEEEEEEEEGWESRISRDGQARIGGGREETLNGTAIFCEGMEVELDQFAKLFYGVSEPSPWPEGTYSFAVIGFLEKKLFSSRFDIFH